MSIPANVVRVAFRGHLAKGEIFETSVWAMPSVEGNTTPATDADALALLTQISDHVDANGFTATWAPKWSASTGLDSMALYSYPNGGPTAAAVATIDHVIAGTGGVALPNQLCLCITTQTGSAGRSKRGRMYWPLTSASLDSAGQLTSAILNSAVSGTATMLSGWATGFNYFPCVVSQTHGYANSIISLKGDSRLDIQRRRAAAELEEVTSTAAVTGI